MFALQKQRRRVWAWHLKSHTMLHTVLYTVCLLACGDKQSISAPESPHNHRVFLTAHEENVVGEVVRLYASVQGCSHVVQAQVLQGNTPLAEIHFENNRAELRLRRELFEPFYPELGIAAQLSLKARAKCANGHVSDSLPVSVYFLPAHPPVEPTDGMAATEHFVATGGTGNTPATFFGCAETLEGIREPFLAHFDAGGNLLGQIFTASLRSVSANTAPFCTFETHFSNSVNGYRWAYTPGNYKAWPGGTPCTLFAFRESPFEAFPHTNFNTGNTTSCAGFVADFQGNAYVVAVSMTGFMLLRLPVQGGALKASPPFRGADPGFFVAPPVISGSTLHLPHWKVQGASSEAHLEVIRFDISESQAELVPLCGPGSALINGLIENCPSIPGDEFRSGSSPPAAVLSPDGNRIYLAGNRANQSFVAAYNLSTATRERSWGPFALPIARLSLSRDGQLLVASTEKAVHFLETTSSSQLGEPLEVSGTLHVAAHLHGPGNSFLLLGSPAYGWPLEAIAVDNPNQGELWRFMYWGTGKTPEQALALAFDNGGHMWMRKGRKFLQLLHKEDYRRSRTPSPSPSPSP